MNNYIKSGVIISFIYLFTNEMTSKFVAGFITGIYLGTKYNFEPYVNLVETKIISLQKELEKYEKSQMIDKSWEFRWPWSDHDISKKN